MVATIRHLVRFGKKNGKNHLFVLQVDIAMLLPKSCKQKEGMEKIAHF